MMDSTYTLAEVWKLFRLPIEQRGAFLRTACHFRSVVVELQDCPVTWFVRFAADPRLGLRQPTEHRARHSPKYRGLVAVEWPDAESLYVFGKVALSSIRRLRDEGEPSFGTIEIAPDASAPIFHRDQLRVIRRDLDDVLKLLLELSLVTHDLGFASGIRERDETFLPLVVAGLAAADERGVVRGLRLSATAKLSGPGEQAARQHGASDDQVEAALIRTVAAIRQNARILHDLAEQHPQKGIACPVFPQGKVEERPSIADLARSIRDYCLVAVECATYLAPKKKKVCEFPPLPEHANEVGRNGISASAVARVAATVMKLAGLESGHSAANLKPAIQRALSTRKTKSDTIGL
jgi:hypothetical protein